MCHLSRSGQSPRSKPRPRRLGQGGACDSNGPIKDRDVYLRRSRLGSPRGAGRAAAVGKSVHRVPGGDAGPGGQTCSAVRRPQHNPPRPPSASPRGAASRRGARKLGIALRPRRMRGLEPEMGAGSLRPTFPATWSHVRLGLPFPALPRVPGGSRRLDTGLCYAEHLPQGALTGSVQSVGGCVCTVVQPPSHLNNRNISSPGKETLAHQQFLSIPPTHNHQSTLGPYRCARIAHSKNYLLFIWSTG